MTRKTLATLGVLLVLLVSLIGTVAAQSESDTETPTTETPTTVTPVPGSKFFTHPVVKLLSAYFDQEVEETSTPEVTETPTTTDTETPGETETVTPEPTDTGTDSGLGPIGEQIAAYHEDGMGFGVLVKVFSIAEGQYQDCLDENAQQGTGDTTGTTEENGGGTTEEVTCSSILDNAATLVEDLKNGTTNMGQLIKQYNPKFKGVGHVKQELKNQQDQTSMDDENTGDTGDPVITTDSQVHPGNGNQNPNKPPKNNKPPKDKSNNGKGPHK